jgi:outer membrane protein TolC
MARLVVVIGCCALLTCSACTYHYRLPKWRHYVGEPQDQNLYVSQATHITYPDVEDPGLPIPEFAVEPRRLRNLSQDEVWDVSLAEAIHTTLMNSRIVRSAGTFMSPSNPLYGNPEGIPTSMDSAIQESGVLFGQRGVEGALSDFDAQFMTSLTAGKNSTIQNNLYTSGGLAPGDTLKDETGQFTTSLQKRLASGAQVGVSQSWNYSANNASARLFPSEFDGTLRTEVRQPLLAGAGAEFNRIAGPISTNIQGVSGVQQGVVIARINNDITLADFEQTIHDLLRDVEITYWKLHVAYRTLDVEERLLQDTSVAWNIVDDRSQFQGPGGGAAEHADARDLCFANEGRLLTARDAMYSAEAELRRLMGLPVNDGRIIRPTDEPISAELLPDWPNCLCDALANRPELRRQKWVMKSLELQKIAADNLTLPRMDMVGSYQLNGFGDNLLGAQNGGMPGQNLGNATANLLSGNHDGWTVGVEFAVPVGRRFALAQVRNLELRVAKAQAVLEEQEREISHELAAAFRGLDRTYLLARNSYNRWIAAQDRYDALKRQHDADSRRIPIDVIVRTRDALAQAELQYVQSLADYNSAILDLHYRSGRLLAVDNVTLSEGPWTKRAGWQANGLGEARSYARPAKYLSTAPAELTGPRPDGGGSVPSPKGP